MAAGTHDEQRDYAVAQAGAVAAGSRRKLIFLSAETTDAGFPHLRIFL